MNIRKRRYKTFKYLNHMKLVKKYQQGGPMPAEGAPAPEAQDPMAMLVEAAMQAVQSGDGNLALQVCQMLLELVGAAQAPVGQPAPGGQPVFKRGGRITRYTSPLDKYRK